jgi:hypothetical protein
LLLFFLPANLFLIIIYLFCIFREEKPVNLQLPRQEFVSLYVPSVKPVPAAKRFSEKIIGSLDAETTSSTTGFFKKRKIAGSARNQRQRVDDE